MSTPVFSQFLLPCLPRSRRENGTTLIELSIVLVVVSVLLGSSLVPMTRIREQRLQAEAEKQLIQVRDRLIGHAMSLGFLPCPVSLDSEPSPQANAENCTNYYGAINASILGGVAPSDLAGRLLDPWNRPIRYALSDVNHESIGRLEISDWSSASEIKQIGVSQLGANLSVCTAQDKVCRERSDKNARAVFVLLSTGADSSSAGLQWTNLNSKTLFQRSPFSNNPDFKFDDHLVWTSQSEIIYWLVRSGQLP